MKLSGSAQPRAARNRQPPPWVVNAVSTPRLHHYLPQFYLKEFTRGEMLWVYDRQSNVYREQHPKTTAAKKHFYSITQDDGTLDPAIEKDLSHIEGRAKPIIAALDNGNNITAEESVHLSAFLALLHSRVPKFEREITEIADQATKALLKRMIPNEEAARQRLKREGRDDIDAAYMTDFVQNERFRVVGPRNNALLTMLRQWRDLAELFAIMNWTVAHADDRTSFITTDAPFAFIVSDELLRSGKPVLGVGSFEVTKVVPLTRHTCLLLGDKGVAIDHVDLPRDRVREINVLLASECDRFVFAADEAHLKSVVRRSAIDRKRTGTRMRVDHIQHPTKPDRTFMITHRVPVDAPDEPLRIVVED